MIHSSLHHVLGAGDHFRLPEMFLLTVESMLEEKY